MAQRIDRGLNEVGRIGVTGASMQSIVRRLGAPIVASLMVLAAALAPAAAQVRPVSSQDASGTITSTGAYQSVLAYNANRSGCTIQNNGSNNMTVKIGASAWTLKPATAISCNNGAIVLTDAVTIAGTAGDAFTAAQQ